MVELIVRLSVALAFIGMGLLGWVPFDAAWKSAAVLSVLSFLGWQLEEKGFKKGGVAGFFAIAESFILALFLAASGNLSDLGFLVLIPCVYAGARFGSPMISMAPLAASALVAADSLHSKSGMPSPQVLIHAAGVLSVSLLLGFRRHHAGLALPAVVEVDERTPQVVEDGMLQLRENYRRLRDAYTDLERRSKKDKIAARIGRAQGFEGERFFAEICAALKELSRAEEIAIYTLAQFDEVMVVRSVSEDYPGELKDRTIEVDVDQAPIIIREQAENALTALSAGAPVANILLIHHGKMLGMVCAIEPNRHRLEEIRKQLTEAAPYAAKAIDAEIEREARIRRVKELELLYEMTSITSGATTPPVLAGRTVREMHQSLRLDSSAISFIEEGEEIVLAKAGTKAQLLDCMSFAEGPGLEGWLATGAPELILFDVRQDQRCDPEESLRRRIGSFVLIPLWVGSEVTGYLSAATHAAGGIDLDQIATLRIVACEMSRALERLRGIVPGGLMTP
ncbi:MAG TPA: GAF domain-containing protein, partial [Fimbriimonadaceae bacterium]|nr:GAF domain-containing protein [Fimbriimonadaceae bacterium]